MKVDREERPDIDHIYMTALHALGQQGGWPLTMFLDPEGKPMFGGTYWPPEPRWGRPGFRQILESVDAGLAHAPSRRWRSAAGRCRTIWPSFPRRARAASLTPDDLTRVGDGLLAAVDPVHGGIGGAPKFPNAPIFRFFWNEMFRRRDPRFGEAVRALLEAMSAGGIYDHLGGGYARYSTDAEWLVPHFEKMLYDNAQILELLALVQPLWPDPLMAERARETVGWLMREMRVGDAFAASLDADQEGEEGAFYVWREEEIDAALGEASKRFKAAYDVTPGGNWEGKTVLRRLAPLGSPEEEADLAASRAKLFAIREKRARPARDDKVLADWNGLAIAALARASAAFGEPDWLVDRPLGLRFRHQRRCAAPTGGCCTPGATGGPARAACSTTMPRWPGRARPLRSGRRPRRSRRRSTPRERGARAFRRRQGRRLSDRQRRRRRSRRAAPPCA